MMLIECVSRRDGSPRRQTIMIRGKKNLQTLGKRWHIPFDGQYAESLSFSNDCKSLAVVSERKVSVIDIPSLTERFSDNLQLNRPSYAALSPDGSTIAVTSMGFLRGPPPTIRLISAQTGNKDPELKAPTSATGWARYSADGKLLLYRGIRGTSIWDLAAGTRLHEITGPADFLGVFSADGRRVAAHGRNAVLVADATTVVRLSSFSTRGTPRRFGTCISPTEKHATSCMGGEFAFGRPARGECWHVSTRAVDWKRLGVRPDSRVYGGGTISP